MSLRSTRPMPTDKQLADDHKYVTQHGRKPAPGVTTIIGLIDKPGLKWGSSEVAAKTAYDVLKRNTYDTVVYEHRQKCMANKRKMVKNSSGLKIRPQHASDDEIFIDYCRGEFDRQWKAKAAKGQRIHDHALAWAQGNPVKELPDEKPYLDALEKWMIDYQPKDIYNEVILLHPNPLGEDELEFGGRPDKIAEFYKRGWTGVNIVDFKTGQEGYNEEKALQFAGYNGAKGMATYNKDGSLGELIPVPKAKHAMTVYLREDGEYKVENPLLGKTNNWWFRYFIDLRRAYNGHQEIVAIENELRKS